MCRRKGRSNKIYRDTDDEPCRQFKEWHIWTHKLFQIVVCTLKSLGKKHGKEKVHLQKELYSARGQKKKKKRQNFTWLEEW